MIMIMSFVAWMYTGTMELNNGLNELSAGLSELSAGLNSILAGSSDAEDSSEGKVDKEKPDGAEKETIITANNQVVEKVNIKTGDLFEVMMKNQDAVWKKLTIDLKTNKVYGELMHEGKPKQYNEQKDDETDVKSEKFSEAKNEYEKRRMDTKVMELLSPEDLRKVADQILDEFPDGNRVGYSLWRMRRYAHEKRTSEFDRCYNNAVKQAKGMDDFQNVKAKIGLFKYIMTLIARDIQGLKVIELNQEELAKLNISPIVPFNDSRLNNMEFRNNNLGYKLMTETTELDGDQKENPAKFNYPSGLSEILYKNIVELFMSKPRSNQIELELKKYTGWAMDEFDPLAPVAITSNLYIGDYMRLMVEYVVKGAPNARDIENFNPDSFSKMIESRNSIIKDDISADYNKLIPVLLKIGDQKSEAFPPETMEDEITSEGVYIRKNYDFTYAEYRVWYYPNEAFLKAIPKKYSDVIRKELDVIAKVAEGEMNHEDACEAVKGDGSFLGVCRMTSAGISNVKIYPNPMQNRILNVEFRLENPAKLTFALHNLAGHFIADLKSGEHQGGLQKITLELDKTVQPGIYLFSITSDKGDNVVHKLIVQ